MRKEEGIGFSLDTAGDTLEKIYIDYVKWVGTSTCAAGNVCLLKDANARADSGGRIFSSIANGANFMDIQYIGKYFDKIILNTIDNGVLFIATKFTNEK